MTTGAEQSTASADIEWRRVYWQPGQPKGTRFTAEVSDAPCSGHQAALFWRDGKRFRIFCPYSMKSFSVSDQSQEYAGSAPCETFDREYVTQLIQRKWANHEKLGIPADFDTASEALQRLGGIAPQRKPETRPEDTEKRAGGKYPAPKLLKPIVDGSKKAEVFKFFREGGRSVNEGCKHFSREGAIMSRSNLLSQLFCLHRDHGIGYSLNGDRVALQVPGEVDPIQQPQPKKEKKNVKSK